MVIHFAKAYHVDDHLDSHIFYEETIENTSSGIAFLLDLHAHAAKRGCFLYGNRLKSPKLHAEILLYARLTSANSAFMDFDGCCFSQVKEQHLCALIFQFLLSLRKIRPMGVKI